MRKILRQKFWSLGTPLGSLGPGSQGDVRPRACKCQIQVICGPCEPPVLVTLQGQAENPKTAGAWCAIFSTENFRHILKLTKENFQQIDLIGELWKVFDGILPDA